MVYFGKYLSNIAETSFSLFNVDIDIDIVGKRDFK